MKTKLSALILGLTFAGISHAVPISWVTGGFGSVDFPGNGNDDTLSAAAGQPSGTINLTYGVTDVGRLLFNVVLGYQSSSNASATITNQGNAITVTDGAPAAAQNIIISYLGTITGDGTPRVHVLSGTSPTLFFNFANGDHLRISNITVATTGNSVSSNGNGSFDIAVRGDLLLTPEPGTWILLGSSLIGLGLIARRRKTTNLGS